MSEVPSNAWAQLHDEGYARAFETRSLDHRSLILMANRPRHSLAGDWCFTLDPFDEGLRQHWYRTCFLPLKGRTEPWDYDIHNGETMQLPSCWNLMRPELYHYEGTAWFGRFLELPAMEDEERLFLRIGAAATDTKIFLDGAFIGHHLGGSTPFFIKLTGRARNGSFLHLCVNNRGRAERVPMHHIDWFNYGGVFREIELIVVPQDFIRRSFVRLDGDEVAIDVELSDACDGALDVSIDGLGETSSLPVVKGRASGRLSLQPKRWSPEAPHLYDVRLSFGSDQVTERIGFRHIETRGRAILLNGEPLFLRGTCAHEDDVEVGRCTSEQDIRRRFADAKDLGCNFMRLAHYPHHERAAAIADEVGLMLWQEIPVYWAIDFANPETLDDARNQLAELIERDRNRASVIAWGVGNENADTDDRLHFMSTLAADARRLDPSRLVGAACLVNKKGKRLEDRLAPSLDLIGINEYYGWYDKDIADLIEIVGAYDLDKPLVVTESGADAPSGRRGGAGELFTEDHQAAYFARQLDVVRTLDAIRGFCPWLLYDFRTQRRQGSFQGGFNRKGLIDADKSTRKLAFDVIRQVYERIATG